jgi:hypothetical protein
MNFLRNLLAESELADPTEAFSDVGNKILEMFQKIMKVAMPIVLGVVVALGVFFALKLGLAYAKTEKTDEREEAKKRLVGAVIGFAIGIVAAALMWWLSQSTILESLFV